jgi:hypothetical protein
MIDASDEGELRANFRAHQRRLRLDRPRSSLAAGSEDAGCRALSDCLARAPDRAEFRALIRDAHAALATNPYLHAYLDALAGHEAPRFRRRVALEGRRVLADVLAYALVLERLTRTLAADPRALRALIHHFDAARAELAWRRHVPIFLALKFRSVEHPLRRLLERVERGEVEADFGNWTLAINIAEASAFDLLAGRRGNAAVGRLLARSSAGRASFDAEQGIVTWSRPAAKAWSDLYTVWDIEFIVGAYANFPYVLAKLLIPAVADYAEAPERFIYDRILALYLQVNWGIFLRCERRGSLNLDWPHAELVGPGARSNRACAEDFRR